MKSGILLDADEFRKNPYIRNIRIPTVRIGDYTLTKAAYEPGEILEYAMPDFTKDGQTHGGGYLGDL